MTHTEAADSPSSRLRERLADSLSSLLADWLDDKTREDSNRPAVLDAVVEYGRRTTDELMPAIVEYATAVAEQARRDERQTVLRNMSCYPLGGCVGAYHSALLSRAEKAEANLAQARSDHDDFLEELDRAFGLEDGEESRYSNPEGAAEGIYIDVAAAYKHELDERRERVATLADRIDELCADVMRREAAIKQVRALHRPKTDGVGSLIDWEYCSCGVMETYEDSDGRMTIGPARYPCATIRALDEHAPVEQVIDAAHIEHDRTLDRQDRDYEGRRAEPGPPMSSWSPEPWELQ